MATASLALALCLFAQDGSLPPASLDDLPPRAGPIAAGAMEQPSSRRPRAATPAADERPGDGYPAAPPGAAVDDNFAPRDDERFRDVYPDDDDDGLDDKQDAGQPADRFDTRPFDTTPPERSVRPPPTVPPASPPNDQFESAAQSHSPGSPGAVLAEAAAIPAQLEVGGAPLRLLDLLSRARDPRVRLPAIDAYWAVATAWIAAQWQWWDHDFIERMEAMSPEAPDAIEQQAIAAQFRSRLSSTEADLRQAEGELVEAQQRLATLLRLPANEPLPLAVDLPHVGGYRTRIEALYAGQTVPERPLAIHRMLPLRERELKSRAAAIVAARDALDAAEAGYQQGSVALDTVMSRLDDQTRERLAFLAAVRKYNYEIAEYALVTPIPAADDRTLAARLIKLRPDDGHRTDPRQPAAPPPAAEEPAAPIATAPSANQSSALPAQHLQGPPGFGAPGGVEPAGFNAPRRGPGAAAQQPSVGMPPAVRVEGRPPAAGARPPISGDFNPPPR